MDNVLTQIKIFSDILAIKYNLSLDIFFLVYIASFIPFYFGYFLILHGSSRNIVWKDIFSFKFRNQIQWSSQSQIGLYIHMFGRLMPYAYILFWGKNIPPVAYVVLFFVATFILYLFFKKLRQIKSIVTPANINILRLDKIIDQEAIEKLWLIYSYTFDKVNKISPCKQSFDEEHFIEVLGDDSVRKYIISEDTYGYVGIGLITDNFKNTPWISEEYFKFNFPLEHKDKLLYYFMGLAIDEEHRGKKYSIKLLEHIIDDLPHNSIMGFDHSKNINPILHYFTKVVRQAKKIRGYHIDRQHYHVVTRI